MRQPRYPIYVVSKGRWDSRLTVRALENIGVDYRIAVEPQEFESYARVIDERRILVLPFSNLGQGSIPARNFVWEHAKAAGAFRHWVMDDNIDGFYRLNENLKVRVESPATICAHEDWVDRFENVAESGFDYFMFAPRKTAIPPFRLNTRIYSCILLRTDLPYRWRGRYNEDTDLSLRILKDGWCTVLFSAFLCYKMPTMTMSGGNMEVLYKGDGRLKMAESLVEQHPDCASIVYKWGRYQHQVDYSRFKVNRLVPKEGVVVPAGVDNYGMVLRVFSSSDEAKAYSPLKEVS